MTSIRQPFSKLVELAHDHTTVTPESVTMWSLRVGGMLAFWVEQIALIGAEVAAANTAAEVAYANSVLENLDPPEGQKRPTVKDAELRASIDPTVLASRVRVADVQRDFDFAKRTYDTISKASTAVKSVINKQTAELRSLPGQD